MCTVLSLWFIACSILITNASILNDLQEAQKLVEQLDYDYSAVAAQQRPAADSLWYDYGGGGSSSNGGVSGNYYSGGEASILGPASSMLIGGNNKRDGEPAAYNSNSMWFGPRLGRKKRRGGGGPTFNGGLVQTVDGNGIGQTTPQEAIAMGLTTAVGQAVVSDLINNGPWLLVPIVDNSLFSQMQMKQNTRNGRSSLEDGDEAGSSSRHTARSPPYSPPFSPRLGRQASIARPQVPRLGRETLLYRRDARGAIEEQHNAALLRRQRQQQQQQAPSAVTESAAAASRRLVA